MLPTENYKRALKYGKIIIRNTVTFSTPDTVKRHFDDVIITSALYSHIAI